MWEGDGIGWLNGFDELVVRCGLESNGAPDFSADGKLLYPLHGKIGNTPAHKVEVSIDGDSGEIIVSGEVDEARLFGNKLRLNTRLCTQVGDAAMTIQDVVSNRSALPGELELLYHINMGMPLLGPGARIHLPLKKLAPHSPGALENLPRWNAYGEEGSIVEVVYCCEPLADSQGWTQAVLENAQGNQGFSIQFNKQQLPYFALWKNLQSAADGYVTGMEPTINFPNPRSFEKAQGRVAVLAAGESRSFELTLGALGDADAVAAAKAKVAAIQGDTQPEILAQPDPKWSNG